MRIDLRTLLPLFIAGSLSAGCTESQRPTATGEGTIQGVHAVSTAPEINFLIEERSLGVLSYRDISSAQAFDDLTYNFNFDARLPGASEVTRIASQSLTVVPDTDYVFALTGTLNDPAIVLWETPERQWDGSETVLEASAGHLAPGIGNVDVYLAPPGTVPAAGQARGTLAFGEKLPPFEIESGQYVLSITAAGDAASVLFASNTQTLDERTSVLFRIQDPDPSITSPVSVIRDTRAAGSSDLAAAGFPPTLRLFHAASGTTSLDVVAGEDFAAPIVANLAYGAISADVPVAVTATYSLTQAGNPGALLHEGDITAVRNRHTTAFVAGAPGDLEFVTFPDNRRPLAGLAKLRITQVSTNFEEADVYLLAAGTDIADSSPRFPGIDSLVSTGYVQLLPDSYELTVTVAGEKTVAAGPVALNLAAGSVTELAIVDTADPNVLDVVVYDN